MTILDGQPHHVEIRYVFGKRYYKLDGVDIDFVPNLYESFTNRGLTYEVGILHNGPKMVFQCPRDLISHQSQASFKVCSTTPGLASDLLLKTGTRSM